MEENKSRTYKIHLENEGLVVWVLENPVRRFFENGMVDFQGEKRCRGDTGVDVPPIKGRVLPGSEKYKK